MKQIYISADKVSKDYGEVIGGNMVDVISYEAHHFEVLYLLACTS